MKRSIVWFVLLTFGLNAIGQKMSDMVDIAVQNNLSLKSTDAKANSIREGANTVAPMPDPEIGVGAFPLPVETRLGAQLFRVSAIQMFPWPGLTEAKKQTIKTQAEIEMSRWDAQRNDITYQVRSNYLKLYDLSEKEKILQRNLNILEDLKDLVEGDIRSGKKSTADAILVEARILKMRSEIAVLDKNRQKLKIELNRLMNRPVSSEIELDEEFSFFSPDSSFWSMARLESLKNPSLTIIQRQDQWLDSELRKNELSGAPSFGFGLDYIAVGERSDAEINNNGRDIIQLKAMLRLPIFRDQFRSREDQLLLMKESYAFDRDDKHQALLSQIDQLRLEYESTQIRYAQYLNELELITDVLDIMESEYSVGERDITEILQLELERVKLEEKLLDELINSKMIEIQLKKIYFK